ncbi:hypothetical protein HDR58_03895, partial [bacterium]|nr:hypothetical protein [bacterium]
TEGDDNVIVKLTYDKAADEAEATVKFLYTVGTDESAVPAFNALPANTPATGSSNYVDTTGIEIPATTAGKIYVKVLAYTETTTGEGENATTTVTALASTPASFEYTVKSAKVAPAMPTATVNGNAVANDGNVTVTESATVALASADSADIYYTDNNSTPDSSSTKYEGSFTVTATKTIKAIAIKDGLSSDVLTFTVTVNSNSYDDEGDEENEYNDWWTEDRAEIKEKNNGKIPAGLWIAGIYSEGYDYTGDKITPYVRVYHNVHLLAEKIDYTISYKNNVNVPTTDAANKQPTIVVKGKGNYAKQATETFKINPRSMGDESVYIDEMTVLAKKNGAALKPVPTVILSYWLNDDVEKERKLKNKKEFEVKYCTEAEYDAAESLDKITGTDSVSEPGSYRMIVTGKGNYSGISSASLEVLKSDAILASKLKVKVGKITYSKDEAEKVGFEGFKPSVEVTAGKTKLTEDTDYTLYYRNNYEAGTAYVTISPVAKTTGEGEDATTTYAFYGSRTVAFTITGKPIKSAKVTVKPEALTYSYNWDGIIDSSDITLEYKGTSLSQGEDYGISWIQNNYAAGKATIYIYGNGEYTGELKKVVKINPRDLSDSSISVTPDTISGAFSKGGTRPVITVKYTYDAENEYSYNLVEGRDYTVTYKNNNNFKKSPSLVIKGKGNFKGSINKTFTFATKDISEVYFDVPNVVVNKGGKYGSKPVLSDRNGTKEVKLAVKKDYTLAYYDMTEKADEPSTEADGDNEDKEEGTPISNINKFTDGKAGSVIKVVATAVEGSGYTGKATRYYSIRENDFGKVKIKVANKEFTGKAVTLTADDITITGATLTLQESADSETDGYYIDPASYVNNIKKGTAKVTLIGTGKYAGSKTVSFKITAKEVKWDRGTTNE